MQIPSFRVIDNPVPVWIGRRERATLQLIARHDRQFGRVRWAATLAGEPSAVVREYGLDKEPEFGVLERRGLRGAYAALETLDRAGLVRTVDVGHQSRVLELTPDGHRALGRAVRTPPREPIGFPRVEDQVLFDRLVCWRNELSARSGWNPSEIARLRHLRTVVKLRPKTMEELAPLLAPDAVELFGPVALEVLHEGREGP